MLAVVGLVLVPVVGSVAAIIVGVIARGELRRDPTLRGDGLATAGIALGVATIVVFAVGIALLYWALRDLTF